MRFRFIGASGGHVTGSCTHFHYDRKNIQFLVDCGLTQGEGDDLIDNSKPFPFVPSEIRFILLTHAHQDHCGLIPRLYKEGFTGSVICTKATARLAEISLYDSAKHSNGLYTEDDVKKIRFDCIDEREGFGLSRMLPIAQDLFASFTRSAHILGSMSISIGWLNDHDEKVYIVMSGDLGNNTKENPYQPLLASRQGIFGYPEAIIVESTYGGRIREDECSNYDKRISGLKEIVQKEVFDNKTTLVIPAFSLHRTQELLVDLYCVFKNNFATEDDSKAPFLSENPWYDEFENNSWNRITQESINFAIESLSTNDQLKWKNYATPLEGENGLTLKDGAEVSISDIKTLVSEKKQTYLVDIVLDSNLAREMSAVYREELCRRQQNNPDETIHRNRFMAERFGVDNEEQVDEVIKYLLPETTTKDIDIPIGVHNIKYMSNAKISRTAEINRRGKIIITGGGMCNGGPIIKHLQSIINSKRAVILLTGYTAKGSLGEKLLNISNAQNEGLPFPYKALSIGDSVATGDNFRAKVIQLQGFYSGHADQNGLLDYIFKVSISSNSELSPKKATVFINHGLNVTRKQLKEAIETRAGLLMEGDREIAKVELPNDQCEWYNLNTKEWVETEPKSKTEELIQELIFEQRKTNNLLQQLITQRSNDTKFKSNSKLLKK